MDVNELSLQTAKTKGFMRNVKFKKGILFICSFILFFCTKNCFAENFDSKVFSLENCSKIEVIASQCKLSVHEDMMNSTHSNRYYPFLLLIAYVLYFYGAFVWLTNGEPLRMKPRLFMIIAISGVTSVIYTTIILTDLEKSAVKKRDLSLIQCDVKKEELKIACKK